MNTQSYKELAIKHLYKLSHLQEQLNEIQKDQIPIFYSQNSKIPYTTLIALVIGSLYAKSDNMELYADLVQYYHQQQNFRGKHGLHHILVVYLDQTFKKYRSHNVLGFCVQLLKRKVLFPNDMKIYHEAHFLYEFPNMLQKYSRMRVYYFVLEIPNEIENPLLEIDKRRTFAYVNIPIAYSIRHDDLDSFQKLMIENMASYDISFKTIPWFDRNEMISLDPVTCIQYACFYGSIKCFKFLVANGAKITEMQKSVVSTQEFAIHGGNEEIIHICQQKGLCFFNNKCLEAAIKFHHMELVEWILINMKDKQSQNISDGSSRMNHMYQLALSMCVSNNAFIIFKKLLSNMDIDEKTRDFTKLEEEINFRKLLHSVPKMDTFVDYSGLDMMSILFPFSGKKYKYENHIGYLNIRCEEEEENESACFARIKHFSRIQEYLKIDEDKFIKEMLKEDNRVGQVLFAMISASCQANPNKIEEYASVVMKFFKLIEKQENYISVRENFIESIQNVLSIETVKEVNKESNNQNEALNDENMYDFQNKNSLICLIIYLIKNGVLQKNEIENIECMKNILNSDELQKRTQGMLSNPIAASILSDDVEGLKMLNLKITTADINQSDRQYDWSNIVSTAKRINWIQYSAFYGAKNCFLYLMENFFNDPIFTKKCGVFAQCSGNDEITKFVKSSICDEETIAILIQSQRNDLVIKMLNEASLCTQIFANYAFYFNNFEVVAYLIESNMIDEVDLCDVMTFCKCFGHSYHIALHMMVNEWNHKFDFIRAKQELEGNDDDFCNIA